MAQIHLRLAKIQSTLKAPKSQRNTFGNYNYRSAEDILEAVKPLLIENGCVLTITDEIVMIGERFYVKATATISDGTDSISTSAWAREDESKKGMDGAQVTGSASSYARKYSLNGLFCIDDTKDPDATNTHGKESKAEGKDWSFVGNQSNPLVPSAPKSKAKPVVAEGNELWAKAVSFCKRQGCDASVLRTWYSISDEDINTMNAILMQ